MLRRVLVGVGLFAVGVLLAFELPVGAAEEGAPDAPVDWKARAVAAWSKTCQTCHAVPDVTYETDRAFLGQILETT